MMISGNRQDNSASDEDIDDDIGNKISDSNSSKDLEEEECGNKIADVEPSIAQDANSELQAGAA